MTRGHDQIFVVFDELIHRFGLSLHGSADLGRIIRTDTSEQRRNPSNLLSWYGSVEKRHPLCEGLGNREGEHVNCRHSSDADRVGKDLFTLLIRMALLEVHQKEMAMPICTLKRSAAAIGLRLSKVPFACGWTMGDGSSDQAGFQKPRDAGRPDDNETFRLFEGEVFSGWLGMAITLKATDQRSPSPRNGATEWGCQAGKT